MIARRLSAMVNYQSGFKLAEIDLKLRGPGSFTGVRQSGFPDLKMASLSDSILIAKAKNLAKQVIDDGLDNYPKIKRQLEEFTAQRHLE
jgi:ATP-dependent DNA helicase RecG